MSKNKPARRPSVPLTTQRRAKAPQTIVAALKPLIPAVVNPVVQPVVQRLDRHEELLLEMKASLDVQFQRIATMQAQLDALIAASRGK